MHDSSPNKAGLFSAILTAFLVQTYPMLQVDNSSTTNRLLALGVTSQLRYFGTMINADFQAMNTTLTSLLNPAPFVPSSSARWINCFFFLSLLFSLAAALFGIFAKQWLREFMEWNAALGTPRENVLVRQIRFEDWESWNVAATISAIPALLEFAMTLFLVGIVTLLWTLDSTVAIVVTVAVAHFLAAVAAFTILPIIHRRCPYKSPTSWACVRLVEFIRCKIPLYFLHVAIRLVPIERKDIERLSAQFTVPRTWRERDLLACRVIAPWWRPTKFDSAVESAQMELAKERTIARTEDGITPSNLDRGGSEPLLVAIMEAACLLRALSWVGRASHDTRVRRYISECGESLHFSDAESLPLERRSRVSALVNWCILLAIHQNALHSPLSVLTADSEYHSSDDGVVQGPDEHPTTVTSLRMTLHDQPSSAMTKSNNPYLGLCSGNRQSPLARPYLDAAVGAPFFLRLLVSGLRYSAQHMHEVLLSRVDHRELMREENHTTANSKFRGAVIRRVVETMVALQDIKKSSSVRPEDWRLLGKDWYLDGFRFILCDYKIKGRLDLRSPGLRTHAFRLVSACAVVIARPRSRNLGSCPPL